MDKRTAFVSILVLPRLSLPTAALGTDVCKHPVFLVSLELQWLGGVCGFGGVSCWFFFFFEI